MAYYVKWIGAQDFDGDRSTDLVLVDGLTGEVSVHTGAGGGDFSAPQVLEERTAILALRAADVNLDGDRDLMVLDSPGVDLRSFLLIRNLGGGVFRSDPPLSLPPETRDLDAFDMDADGDLDAVLCGAEAFLVLPNDRAEGFPRRWEIPVPGAGLEATVAGDLDGDGDGDLVGSAPGEVSLAEQVAPGSFTVRSLFSGTVAGKDLLTGDVDGDGDEDVLAGADTSLQVLKNDGQGDFTAGPPIDVGRTLASALAFDAEADGDLDLALSILIRRGSDCFLDGDCSTLLMVLLNDGGAAFTFAIEYRVPYAAESLASADLDADGDADLVATQSFSSTPSGLIPGAGVELLLNAGDGSFRSWGTLPIGNRPSSIAAADLDGDLYPDLALGTEAGVIVMPLRIIRPRAVDADRNGVVDDCEQTPFRRGDWNRDGALNLTDPIAFLEYLFRGGPGSPCAKAGDTDDGGRLDLADAVRILSHLFQGGPAPRAPFAACGLDPTPDSLSCAAFPPCR
jgi:hypothetical protein